MPNQFKDIPKASDILSVSQGDLETNFLYIQGALGKDHQVVVGDTDTGTTFEGRHLSVSLKDRAGNPAHPGDGTDSFLWSNAGNLFWRNAAVGPVQLTDTTVPVAAQTGSTFLPGGMIMQWGYINEQASPVTITWAPAFTAFYVATLTRIETDGKNRGFVQFSAVPSNTSATVIIRDSDGNSITGSFFYIAIGTK